MTCVKGCKTHKKSTRSLPSGPDIGRNYLQEKHRKWIETCGQNETRCFDIYMVT